MNTHPCRREECQGQRADGPGYCSDECYRIDVQGRRITDPKHYMDEPTLAVNLFPCLSCKVQAGTPCEGETHIGRVDKLRSLRAYVMGVS